MWRQRVGFRFRNDEAYLDMLWKEEAEPSRMPGWSELPRPSRAYMGSTSKWVTTPESSPWADMSARIWWSC